MHAIQCTTKYSTKKSSSVVIMASWSSMLRGNGWTHLSDLNIFRTRSSLRIQVRRQIQAHPGFKLQYSGSLTIQIRGSAPLNYASRSYSFLQWLSRCKKSSFFLIFLKLTTQVPHIHIGLLNRIRTNNCNRRPKKYRDGFSGSGTLLYSGTIRYI